MINVFLAIIFFVLAILQIAIMPRLAIFGVFPNLALAGILAYASQVNKKSIFIFAGFMGLALDFFSGLPFGIWIINFLITVWLFEAIGKNFFRSADFSGQAFLIAGACIFFSIFQFFLIKVFAWLGQGINQSFWQDILRVGLREFLLNFAISLLFLLLIKKLHAR